MTIAKEFYTKFLCGVEIQESFIEPPFTILIAAVGEAVFDDEDGEAVGTPKVI